LIMSQQMESREQRVIRPLLEFFSKDANFKLFMDIVVLKTNNIPLRLFDWFVTNYAKKNYVCYNIKRPNNTIENFCVFRSYRAQLKGCKKKEFDPFCRGAPLMLEYESPTDGSKIAFETATCQLKFFKWAIENLILNYVETNYEQIYEDMKINSSKSQKTDSQSQKKIKTELSKSIFQQIHISDQPITMQFQRNKTC